MAPATLPDFKVCGPFNGTDGQSAPKWLRKFEFELRDHKDANGKLDPLSWFMGIDILLAGDAMR